jgi:hypothetical protein
MSTTPPRGVIERTGLSEAWLAALLSLTEKRPDPGSPFIISFTGFNEQGLPLESNAIRECVDRELKARGAVSVETCASMLFPLGNLQLMELRLKHKVSIEELTNYYLTSVYPRLKTQNARSNGRGTYFLRMVNFGGNPKNEGEIGTNQIAKLIEIWSGNKRIVQSALQLAIRDPRCDLTRNPRPFFPCLQQVSFAYDHTNGISITGYYPTQYIFDRAYGNYLGLAHLGWFIAREMKKKLVRVNCICAHPLLGGRASDKSVLRQAFIGLAQEKE